MSFGRRWRVLRPVMIFRFSCALEVSVGYGIPESSSERRKSPTSRNPEGFGPPCARMRRCATTELDVYNICTYYVLHTETGKPTTHEFTSCEQGTSIIHKNVVFLSCTTSLMVQMLRVCAQGVSNLSAISDVGIIQWVDKKRAPTTF